MGSTDARKKECAEASPLSSDPSSACSQTWEALWASSGRGLEREKRSWGEKGSANDQHPFLRPQPALSQAANLQTLDEAAQGRPGCGAGAACQAVGQRRRSSSAACRRSAVAPAAAFQAGQRSQDAAADGAAAGSAAPASPPNLAGSAAAADADAARAAAGACCAAAPAARQPRRAARELPQAGAAAGGRCLVWPAAGRGAAPPAAAPLAGLARLLPRKAPSAIGGCKLAARPAARAGGRRAGGGCQRGPPVPVGHRPALPAGGRPHQPQLGNEEQKDRQERGGWRGAAAQANGSGLAGGC